MLAPEVFDRAEQFAVDRPPCQSLKRRRADELSSRLGHDDRHGGTGLHQLAAQVGRLVRRDAACHSQQ